MSKVDLANHFDCPLETIGLAFHSNRSDIVAAAHRELDDLEDAYGRSHGITFEEMRDYLTKWVAFAAEMECSGDMNDEP